MVPVTEAIGHHSVVVALRMFARAHRNVPPGQRGYYRDRRDMSFFMPARQGRIDVLPRRGRRIAAPMECHCWGNPR